MTGFMSPSTKATSMAAEAAKKEEEAALAAQRQTELDTEYRRKYQRGRQATIVQPVSNDTTTRTLLGA